MRLGITWCRAVLLLQDGPAASTGTKPLTVHALAYGASQAVLPGPSLGSQHYHTVGGTQETVQETRVRQACKV